MSWKTLPNAELYLPSLASAEIGRSIPTDLLARIACEESHFRDDTVHGPANSAKCIGLMQLNTVYYPDAGKDWRQDIEDAAALLIADYRRFTDWQCALAAYNDGSGNVHQWILGNKPMPAETQKYVRDIIADVPVPGRIL